MHKQSFAECHSLATKAPLARPSMHFSSKIPEVSYNPDYTINAATSAKIA